MVDLKDLLSPEIYGYLKGKTHEGAVDLIIESVGKEAWEDFIKDLSDEDVAKILSIATEGGVNDGESTLNSENSESEVDETVEAEENETVETVENADDTAVETEVVESNDENADVDTVDTVESTETAVDSDGVPVIEDPVVKAYIESLIKRAEDAEQAYREALIASSIEVEAFKAGCRDVDDIRRFVDASAIEVNDGVPVGVPEVISTLKKSKPYLFEAKVSNGASTGFNPAKPSGISGYYSGMSFADAYRLQED